jgi:hypothetical protein
MSSFNVTKSLESGRLNDSVRCLFFAMFVIVHLAVCSLSQDYYTTMYFNGLLYKYFTSVCFWLSVTRIPVNQSVRPPGNDAWFPVTQEPLSIGHCTYIIESDNMLVSNGENQNQNFNGIRILGGGFKRRPRHLESVKM